MNPVFAHLTSKRKQPSANKRLKNIDETYLSSVALDLFELTCSALQNDDTALLKIINANYHSAVVEFFTDAPGEPALHTLAVETQFLTLLCGRKLYHNDMRVNIADTKNGAELKDSHNRKLRDSFPIIDQPHVYDRFDAKHSNFFSPSSVTPQMTLGYLLSQKGLISSKSKSIASYNVLEDAGLLTSTLLLLNEARAPLDDITAATLFDSIAFEHLTTLRLTRADHLPANTQDNDEVWLSFASECHNPIEKQMFSDFELHTQRIQALSSFKMLLEDIKLYAGQSSSTGGWPRYTNDGQLSTAIHPCSTPSDRLTHWNSEALLMRAYGRQMERLCKVVVNQVPDTTIVKIAPTFLQITKRLWDFTGGNGQLPFESVRHATMPNYCHGIDFSHWGDLFAQCYQAAPAECVRELRFDTLPTSFVRSTLSAQVFDDYEAAAFLRSIKLLSLTRSPTEKFSTIHALAEHDGAALLHTIHRHHPDLYEKSRERVTALMSPQQQQSFDHVEAAVFKELNTQHYTKMMSHLQSGSVNLQAPTLESARI